MDDDLTLIADAYAFGAHSGHILQRHVHDAALPRRHGIQPERLAGSLHALRRNTRRHAQFLKPQRAVAAAIDMNLFMVSRLQPQRPKSQVFERFQNFTAVLQENFFVFAVQIGKHFRATYGTLPFRRNRPHAYFQLQPGSTHDILQKLTQRIGRCLAVQFPIADEFLSH